MKRVPAKEEAGGNGMSGLIVCFMNQTHIIIRHVASGFWLVALVIQINNQISNQSTHKEEERT